MKQLPYKTALKKIVEDRCLSLAALSRKFGRTRQVIDTWDKHTPRLDSAAELCRIIGVSLDDFFATAERLAEAGYENHNG